MKIGNFDTLLEDALRRRGTSAPFSVDVADRVMARVAVLGVPAKHDVRQLKIWAIAASVVGATLLTAAFLASPSVPAVVSSLGHAATSGSETLMKLWAPAASLADKLGRVALAMVSSAQAAVRPLAPFQPLTRALLAAIAASMLGITAVVVGRDVARRAATKEHA